LKVYISKLLLSIFCLLPLFKGELLLPLYAEESWNEKLFDRDNREIKENKKISTYALLYIEASVAKKEQRYDDLLNITKDILKNIEKDFGENSKFTGSAHLIVAASYKLLGKLKNAEFHYKKSLEILSNKKNNDLKGLANAKNRLGLFYLEQGIYNKAETELEEALKIKEKEYGMNDIMLVTTLNHLGILFNQQNFLKLSEKKYQRALDILIKNKKYKSGRAGMILINLGTLYLKKRTEPGKYDYYMYEAESFISRGIEIYEEVFGRNHLKTINAKENLAGVYTEGNKFNKSIKILKEVLKERIKKLGKDHPDNANTYNNLAINYGSLRMFNEEESSLLKAYEISNKNYGQYHILTNSILSNLSDHYLKRNFNQKGSIYLEKAITNNLFAMQKEAPFLPLDDRPIYLLNYEGDFLRLFNYAAIGKLNPDTALFARLNKQGLLQEIEKKQYKIIKSLGNESKLIKNLIQLNSELTKLKQETKEWQKKLIEKINLEREIYRIIPEFTPTLTTKNDLLKFLPRDSILIEFQSYYQLGELLYSTNRKINQLKMPEKGYIAILLKPNGETKVIDLGNAKNINKYINDAILNVKEFPEKSLQLWDIISDTILDPIYDDFKDFKNLYISPDSAINLVPFAALKSPNSDSYLNEIYNIRLITTGRELLKGNFISSNLKSIVVANPYFGENNIQNFKNKKRSNKKFPLVFWDSLSGTEKEGLAISEIIEADLIMGKKATEEFIFKNTNPKILHIASHSYFFSDKEMQAHPLMRSGIVLSGVNNQIKDPSKDGYLTSLEFSKLELNGTDLVVISGCDSGRGVILPTTGDEFYGLKRAISVAGAKSSLLSLWKVSDDKTALFMEYFYKNLKKGKGKSEALDETINFFKNNPNKNLRSPYIWAAFQLSGDWRPIKF